MQSKIFNRTYTLCNVYIVISKYTKKKHKKLLIIYLEKYYTIHFSKYYNFINPSIHIVNHFRNTYNSSHTQKTINQFFRAITMQYH